MRYTPVALALSLLVAVTSSVSFSAPSQPLDPRASALLSQGRAQLSAGRVEDAVDSRPDAMIVVACGDGTAAVRCLAELQRSGVQAFVVAIIPADLRAAEWRLRELGADAVVGDDVGADAVADVCRWALRTAESRG